MGFPFHDLVFFVYYADSICDLYHLLVNVSQLTYNKASLGAEANSYAWFEEKAF